MYTIKPGSNPNIENKPRILTDDEIDFITYSILGGRKPKNIPKPSSDYVPSKWGKRIKPFPGCSKRARAQAIVQIIYFIRRELKTREFDPSRIYQIRDEISRSLETSLVQPGESVGSSTAEAFGASVTQGALSSFKTSGTRETAKQTSNINSYRELIFANKDRSDEKTFLFFENRHMSYNEILSRGAEIVEVNLRMLVNNPEIYTSSEIFELDSWWYKPFLELYQVKLPDPQVITYMDNGIERKRERIQFVLRLELDIEKLFEFRVTMGDILELLRKERPGSITVIASPISLGYIDIWPHYGVVNEVCSEGGNRVAEDSVLNSYLDTFIRTLDKAYIKGIKGVESIEPNRTPVLSLISHTKKEGRILTVSINTAKFSQTRILKKEFVNLIEGAGFLIEELGKDSEILRYKITLPEDYEKYLEKEGEIKEDAFLNTLLQNMIGRDKDDRILFDTPLGRLSSVTYLVVRGKGILQELFKLTDVDCDRTYCNNLHEMCDVLDIEAARTLLGMEIDETTQNSGSFITPNIRTLMCDIICSLGVPVGLTSSGAAKGNTGFYSHASIDRSLQILLEAASRGNSESLKNTYPAIAVGTMISQGTGIVEIFEKDSNNRAIGITVGNNIKRGRKVTSNTFKEYYNSIPSSNKLEYDIQRDIRIQGDAKPVIPSFPGMEQLKVNPPPVISYRGQSGVESLVDQLKKIQQGEVKFPATKVIDTSKPPDTEREGKKEEERKDFNNPPELIKRKISIPIPKTPASVSVPKLPTPAPKISIPIPKISIPIPRISVPAAKIPIPKISIFVPKIPSQTIKEPTLTIPEGLKLETVPLSSDLPPLSSNFFSDLENEFEATPSSTPIKQEMAETSDELIKSFTQK